MAVDLHIENAILKMAAEKGPDKTICPSEVARVIFPDNWRNHMNEIRTAAFKLQEDNKVLVTQKGQPVTEQEQKGPVRIKIRH